MFQRVFRRNMVSRGRPQVTSNAYRGTIASQQVNIPREVISNGELYWGTPEPQVKEEAPKVEDNTDRIDHISHTNVSIGNKAVGEICRMICDPTGNCQIQSMVNFNLLLQMYSNDKIVLDYLYKGWRKSAKKTELLLDVPAQFESRVEGLFKLSDNDIIIKAPYQNNTKSEMIIYLVQLRNKFEREGFDV